MATEVHYGTGRRKRSVARVFIKRGKGEIQVNKKPLDEFFDRVVKLIWNFLNFVAVFKSEQPKIKLFHSGID